MARLMVRSKGKPRKVASKGLILALKLASFVLLLLIGRLLRPVANVAIAAGTLIFLFCGMVRPDLTVQMWAGGALAVGATGVTVFYDAALRLVAPEGTVIVSDL